MDDNRFDAFTRRLATGRSRRAVLRGLVGGGAALVADRSVTLLAAQPDTVAVCHLDDETGTYQVLDLPSAAVSAHLEHGDFLFGGCCTNADCDGGDACTQPATCQEGVCIPGASVTCSVTDDCYAAFCDPVTGCEQTYRGDGQRCGILDDVCFDGACCTPYCPSGNCFEADSCGGTCRCAGTGRICASNGSCIYACDLSSGAPCDTICGTGGTCIPYAGGTCVSGTGMGVCGFGFPECPVGTACDIPYGESVGTCRTVC